MATLAEDGFIFTLDDDVMFSKRDVLETCLREISKAPPNLNPIVGYTGVILNNQKHYWRSLHVHEPIKERNVHVDIVKGRFMFMHKSVLNSVRMENEPTCEDIKLSSHSSWKLIPSSLYKSLQNLDEGPEALHANQDQQIKRMIATVRYFSV
jgi:hypothetical protein